MVLRLSVDLDACNVVLRLVNLDFDACNWLV